MAKLKSKKVCCVSSCENSSRSLPKKIMFVVPDAKRAEWLTIAGDRNYLVKRKHICEDHFNLSEDLENYSKFMHCEELNQRQDARAKWKHYVVPHINVPYPQKMEPIKTEVVIYPLFKRNTNSQSISAKKLKPASRLAVDNDEEVYENEKCSAANNKQTEIPVSDIPDILLKANCRFCLVEDANMINLFAQSDFDIDNLCSLVKICIDEDDGLTDKLCLECFEKCNALIEFVAQILRTDKILRTEFIKSAKRKNNIKDIKITDASPSTKEEQSDDELLAPTEAWLLNDIVSHEEHEDAELSDCSSKVSDSQKSKLRKRNNSVENKDNIRPKRKYQRRFKPTQNFIDLKCDLCFEQFSNQFTLSEHKTDCVTQFECPDCSCSFYSDKCLSNHRADKHKNSDRIFICVECDKLFYTENQRSEHMKVHQDKKSFLCHICSKGFTNKCHLNLHLEKHDRSNCKSYECRVCNETFYNDWQIKAHLNGHLKNNELTCDICIIVFKSTLHYARHMNLHQKGEEMFKQCNSPQCERSNKRNCHLLTEDIRKEILISFWRLPTIDEQKKFTSDLVKSVEPFRRYVDHPKAARSRTNLYFLPVKEKLIQVCKETFLNTFNITDKVLQNWTALKKRKNVLS